MNKNEGNTIENPLVITCIGNTFKLNKRLIIEDEESFEFVDKQLALKLKEQANIIAQESFEQYLITNYKWNGASWGDRNLTPHITKSTDTIYNEYMNKFHSDLMKDY